jgi:hypothetical protein
MPAASAASTPNGASSKTRHASGAGAGDYDTAAAWNMSGEGFPSVTMSPETM